MKTYHCEKEDKVDPNEAVKTVMRLLDEKIDHEDIRAELIWHLRGIADWLESGGFIPELPGACKRCAIVGED